LVKKLSFFGLTGNQAKVYLAIVEAGSISVGKIAESTKLYRQDIYKILPTLEQKGLATRTLGSPVIIKAIPVRKALTNLVAMRKKAALESISFMETNLNEIANAVSMLYETEANPALKEDEFCLLTSENEIMNAADLLFEKAKTECNVVLNVELLRARGLNFLERFQNAVNNGAIIRLVVENPREEEWIATMVERVRPKNGNFSAKMIIAESPKPFIVIDDKTVWISTSKKQEASGLHCVLWSTGENIVTTYHERFERLWKSKNAVTLALLPIAERKEITKKLEDATDL
jgi:sugar-specific transcriptional regulator TrmB